MSNSNIDNLMIKFAMSRLKRAGMVTPETAAYRDAVRGTPAVISNAQAADGFSAANAYNSDFPVGVTPNGGFLSTQYLSRGPDSAWNPLQGGLSSVMDMPGFGLRGTGVGGDLLAGALAGGATTAGLRAAGNLDLWKYRDMDLFKTPRSVQQRIMETSIQPNGNPATMSRVGDRGRSGTAPEGSPLVQAQKLKTVPPMLKGQSGPSEIQVSQQVPGPKPLPGRLVGMGKPGEPVVSSRSVPQITTENLIRGAVPGAGGIQPNPRSTNPLISNSGKTGLVAGLLAALASRYGVGQTVEPARSDTSFLDRMTSRPTAPVQKSTVQVK